MPSSLTQHQASANATKLDYHILIIEDLQGQRSILLNYATYSVGRDSNNTIQIHDLAASRHHLILIRMPLPHRKYMYRIVDGDAKGKASLNGITINGHLCKKKDLQSGDMIKVGEVTQIKYIIHTMTEDEFEWYFGRQEMEYQSIQQSALDPTNTMTTILAN